MDAGCVAEVSSVSERAGSTSALALGCLCSAERALERGLRHLPKITAWLITGTLTGFGRSLAGALFTRGDRVAEPEY